MADNTKIPMSERALDQLRAELEHLETVERPLALRDVEEALTDSVNVGESGTHLSAIAHKEQLDGRIAELRSRISRAVVVDEADIDTDNVSVGVLVGLDYGDDDVDELLLDHSAAPGTVAVSPASPLGEALLGAKVGDTVTWNAPSGQLSATVVSIAVP